MAFEIAWLDEKKMAIIYSFGAEWNWSEFVEKDKIADEMMSSVNHKVDIIVDFTLTTHFPANALSKFRQLIRDSHPNRGRIILVGTLMLFKTMAGDFLRLIPPMSKDILVVNTLDEARRMIETREHEIAG